VRLGRLLARLMPDEPTVLGLLALMLLTDARRATRVDAAGEPVLLADQDRSRWDRAMVADGMRALDAALRHSPSGPTRTSRRRRSRPCHAVAHLVRGDELGVDRVLVRHAARVHDTPVVRLNRAAAVAERDGPAAGLELLDASTGSTATRGGTPGRRRAAAPARPAWTRRREGRGRRRHGRAWARHAARRLRDRIDPTGPEPRPGAQRWPPRAKRRSAQRTDARDAERADAGEHARHRERAVGSRPA
jgi:hypothetical protein